MSGGTTTSDVPSTPELTQALQAVAQHLTALSARDPQVRDLLRACGQALVAIADASAPQQADAAVTDVQRAPLVQTLPEHSPIDLNLEAEKTFTSFVDLHEALQPTESEPTDPQHPSPADPDSSAGVPPQEPFAPPVEQFEDASMGDTAQRMLLKAEAVRWVLERARLEAEGAAFYEVFEPRERDLIDRAKILPDCYLWMLRHHQLPEDAEPRYLQLAGCFDTAATAVTILELLFDESEQTALLMEQGLLLAAEAQSALRMAVTLVQRMTDRDQLRLFYRLKALSAQENIYLHRFMRADDIANPAQWEDLHTRIVAFIDLLNRSREQRRHEQKMYNKARYHVRCIQNDPSNERLHDWHKVSTVVDELVHRGVPPSSIPLRDLLSPIMHLVPPDTELAPNMYRVFDAIEQFLASEPSNVPLDPITEESDVVRHVRALLTGRSVVIIGGDQRPHAIEALQDAFSLRELIWIETREHQTHIVFEPYVAREDVAVVLLAIRWASHGFGEIQSFCERYGKPLVRLPSGYNPNQVAHQIVQQAAIQLEATQ